MERNQMAAVEAMALQHTLMLAAHESGASQTEMLHAIAEVLKSIGPASANERVQLLAATFERRAADIGYTPSDLLLAVAEELVHHAKFLAKQERTWRGAREA